jgi:hypothetical protein
MSTPNLPAASPVMSGPTPMLLDSDGWIAMRSAEYTALREESLRIATFLSNAVWAAIAGFGLTMGAAAAFAKDVPAAAQIGAKELVPLAALLLCTESVVASALYLGELQKYVRIGHFILTLPPS